MNIKTRQAQLTELVAHAEANGFNPSLLQEWKEQLKIIEIEINADKEKQRAKRQTLKLSSVEKAHNSVIGTENQQVNTLIPSNERGIN